MAYRKLSDKYGLSEQGKVFKDELVAKSEFEEDGPVDDIISYIIKMLQDIVLTAQHIYGEYEEKAAEKIEEDMKNL